MAIKRKQLKFTILTKNMHLARYLLYMSRAAHWNSGKEEQKMTTKTIIGFNKKTFLLVGVILFVFGSDFLSAETNNSNSAELRLQGSVPRILEILVNKNGNADSLDLTVDVADLDVATVIERSNVRAGYTVSLQSENNFRLVIQTNDEDKNDFIGYSLTYGGAQVSPVDGSAQLSDVNEKTGASGSSNKVGISYTGTEEFLYEGIYSDTLTFTITAK